MKKTVLILAAMSCYLYKEKPMKYLLILMTMLTLSIQSSNACSMARYNIELAVHSYGLEASALAALGVDRESVANVEIEDMDGGYIWNNPMCPEGDWVTATFNIESNSRDPLAKGCLGIAKVTRKKASSVTFRGITSKAVNSVTVDIIQESSCLE